MIISHKHRFIFFAIPKTGTHSVRQALRQQMGEQDIEQVELFVKKKFPFPEFLDIPHGHLSARQIRPVIGDEMYCGYRKFAFVRNPFARFVSYCAFMSRSTDVFQAQPLRYMNHVIGELRRNQQNIFPPQHAFVDDEQGKLQLDLIGRTESMQESYVDICRQIGMPITTLGVVNSSSHRPYQDYYNRELIDAVTALYARDLEMFNYRFD